MNNRDREIVARAQAQGFDLAAWLEQRCTLDPDTGCLNWKHYVAEDGTLRASVLDLRGLSVRRFVWLIANPKSILGKRRAFPSCGNPLCLEPSHQKARNVRDAHKAAAKAGSYSCPVAHAKRAAAARLRRTHDHEERAKQIHQLRLQGLTLVQIGQVVGMDYRCVGKVLRGEKWTQPKQAANSSVFAWRPAA